MKMTKVLTLKNCCIIYKIISKNTRNGKYFFIEIEMLELKRMFDQYFLSFNIRNTRQHYPSLFASD